MIINDLNEKEFLNTLLAQTKMIDDKEKIDISSFKKYSYLLTDILFYLKKEKNEEITLLSIENFLSLDYLKTLLLSDKLNQNLNNEINTYLHYLKGTGKELERHNEITNILSQIIKLQKGNKLL